MTKTAKVITSVATAAALAGGGLYLLLAPAQPKPLTISWTGVVPQFDRWTLEHWNINIHSRYILESAPTPTGPWTPLVTTNVSYFKVVPNQSAQFYRIGLTNWIQ